jgi:hypothetical protein
MTASVTEVHGAVKAGALESATGQLDAFLRSSSPEFEDPSPVLAFRVEGNSLHLLVTRDANTGVHMNVQVPLLDVYPRLTSPVEVATFLRELCRVSRLAPKEGTVTFRLFPARNFILWEYNLTEGSIARTTIPLANPEAGPSQHLRLSGHLRGLPSQE